MCQVEPVRYVIPWTLKFPWITTTDGASDIAFVHAFRTCNKRLHPCQSIGSLMQIKTVRKNQVFLQFSATSDCQTTHKYSKILFHVLPLKRKTTE